MGRNAIAALGACGAALLGLAVDAGVARADSYREVEAARANARAGGPVSGRDAELLERYGCLSGTRNRFCEELRGGRKAHRTKQQRRVRR